MLPDTSHTTVDAESFDMSAELYKLRLHYTELKSKKEQEKVKVVILLLLLVIGVTLKLFVLFVFLDSKK